MANTSYSILREKEDGECAKLSLRGRVLDLGGHRESNYLSRIHTELPIEIANFDTAHPGTHQTPSGADHIFDFEKPFPLGDASFDSVLCINVMEHIYNYNNLVSESHRILKQGGTMYVSVPFFFNIHGSPNDYFRYTKAALERILSEHGFTQIQVTELGDGPCSVLFQTFGGSLPTMLLKLLGKHIAMGIDTFFSKCFKKYARISLRVPLGYFVSAKK